MDNLKGLQQRIVSPALTAGRSPSPEPVKRNGWFRRSRPLGGPVRHHSAPLTATLGRPRPQPFSRRIPIGGLSAPGSTRASSPQRAFPDCISDVIIPVPVQMPVDDYNLYRSSGAQSFCSTSKMKFVALPNVSESRTSSTPRCGSRAVALCGERYVVTPVAQQLPTPKPFRSSERCRPLSEQQQRFEEGGRALARCRVLKRTTEILPHRMDRLYYMSGLNVSVRNRYAFDPEALQRMQTMALEARGGKVSPVDRRREPETAAEVESKKAEAFPEGESEDPTASGSVFITEDAVREEPEVVEAAEAEAEAVEATEAEPEAVEAEVEAVEATEAEAEAVESPSRVPTAVRERRRLLFGSSEPPTRTPILSELHQRKVSSMHERFRTAAENSEKEEEEEEEAEEEEEEEDEEAEENMSEERLQKLEEMMKKKAKKKLDIDRSIFKEKERKAKEEAEAAAAREARLKGIRYTAQVHTKEEKKKEFRSVTQHLVVQQDSSTLLVEPNMDEQQAAVFSKIFSELDANNDGRVSLADLQARLFKRIKSVDIPLFMRVFDLNNDHSIDRKEFLAVAGLNDKLCKQKTTAITDSWHVDLEKLSYYITVYREMFNACDLDHDGSISQEELMVIIAASLDERTGTDIELIEDILQAIDRDNNGHIDFVEYLTFIPMFLQLHNYLLKKPMLVEDIEKARRLVRLALENDRCSESSGSNIWDD